MKGIITNAIVAYLEAMQLNYQQNDNIFSLTMCEEEADFLIHLIADEKNDLLMAIGYFPVKVSKSNLDKMYKVINDINDKYMVGAYVIDSDDGELTFRIGNNVDGGAANKEIVESCFLQVLLRLKQTYAEIMKAMYGGEQLPFAFTNEASRPCA